MDAKFEWIIQSPRGPIHQLQGCTWEEMIESLSRGGLRPEVEGVVDLPLHMVEGEVDLLRQGDIGGRPAQGEGGAPVHMEVEVEAGEISGGAGALHLSEGEGAGVQSGGTGDKKKEEAPV